MASIGILQHGIQMFGHVTVPAGTRRSMLCIDADRPYEVMLHVWETLGGDEPFAVLCLAEVIDKGPALKLRARNLYRVNAGGSLYLPNIEADELAHVRSHEAVLTHADNGLKGKWTSSTSEGEIHFRNIAATHAAEVTACQSWEDFKSWVSSRMTLNSLSLFRGHGDSTFALRTTLNRVGRYRLERYCHGELVNFKYHAEAVLERSFDLENADDYGTVLGLAQHHGLPTPLLDWTESPYVAAFFALSDALERGSTEGRVRVYGLTEDYVLRTSPARVPLPQVGPYAFALQIGAKHNKRLYVQQGRFIVTNVGNLEAHIAAFQAQNGQALYAADIPVECITEGLRDLRTMGLTAGALFPGLDGICRMLKHNMLSPLRRVLPEPGDPVSTPTSPPQGPNQDVQSQAASPDMSGEVGPAADDPAT